jgi:hypothetical protein
MELIRSLLSLALRDSILNPFTPQFLLHYPMGTKKASDTNEVIEFGENMYFCVNVIFKRQKMDFK